MARVAKKDTYGFEEISGVEIRRVIRAGDPIPSNVSVPEDALGDELPQRTLVQQPPSQGVVYEDAEKPVVASETKTSKKQSESRKPSEPAPHGDSHGHPTKAVGERSKGKGGGSASQSD